MRSTARRRSHGFLLYKWVWGAFCPALAESKELLRSDHFAEQINHLIPIEFANLINAYKAGSMFHFSTFPVAL